MKKLFIITLIFLFQSSLSFSDWSEVTYNDDGTSYVDFQRIRKVDGYTYYWMLVEINKPLKDKTKSFIVYTQSDCKTFKLKRLDWTDYDGSMGSGNILRSFTPKGK